MAFLGLHGFLVVIQLIWICLTSGINGEMRFVCPRPQLPNSRILEGECGTGPEEPFERNFMEVSPGPFTIQLEETVAHKGSPIRIALMEWGTNSPPCVLLDHIPHNDQATVRETQNCRINGYPIGKCYGAATFVTVEIPDIDCQRCVLQMINVATDEYSADQEPCHQTEPSTNNCTTFYSCANIRILPTARGVGKNLGACINHQLTLLNRWPYTPAEKYSIELGPPFEETNYFHLYERPDWSVYYEMSLSSANLTVRRAGSVALFEGTKPVRFFGSNEGRLKILTVDERRKLKAGNYVIRITGRFRNGTFRNFNIPVNGSISLYGENLYRDHSAVYSVGGMLAEKRFRGPGATYPQVNFPAGECQAQGIESFGSVLTLYKSVLPRAMVTFTMNKDLLYAHIASSFELDRVVFTTRWNNTKEESQRQNLAFNRGGTKGVFYEGADFVGDYMTKTGRRRPTQITMVVRREGKLEVLYGDIHKGIQGVLRNDLTNLGLVFVTFPDDSQVFNLHIMISNSTSLLAEGYEMSLITPFQSFSINQFARILPLDSYMVFYNITVPIVDLEIAQFFWTGQIAVTIRDVHTRIVHSAKLDPLSERVCEASKNIACKSKILLSEDGGPVDRGDREVFANGLATIGASAEQKLLSISISVRDVHSEETVTSVELLRRGIDSLKLPAVLFSRHKNRIYGLVQISVDNRILRDIADGSLTLVVTLKRPGFNAASIRGRVPRSAANTPGLRLIARPNQVPSETVPPPPPQPSQPPPAQTTTVRFKGEDIWGNTGNSRRRGAANGVPMAACGCFFLVALSVIISFLL